MIDFHAHLDLYPDPDSVVEKIIEHQMYVLSVTTTPSAWRGTYALARHYSRIRTALGLHPQIAHERYKELDMFDLFLNETKYVGEIGLDGSKGFSCHLSIQVQVFEQILNSCSKAGGKIMSIHSRGAATKILDLLSAYPDSGIPILHWFSGSKNELLRAIEIGCWFSVGPAMLRSKRSKETVSLMPNNRVLTESDGPFVKFDGRTIYPWDVRSAIQSLSEIWNLNPLEIEVLISNNLKKLVS